MRVTETSNRVHREGDRASSLCAGAGRFLEDYNGVVPCPVSCLLMNVKLTLSCTPPLLPLLLGSCVWKRVGAGKIVACVPEPEYPCTGVRSGGLSYLVLIQPPEMNLCDGLRRQPCQLVISRAQEGLRSPSVNTELY